MPYIGRLIQRAALQTASDSTGGFIVGVCSMEKAKIKIQLTLCLIRGHKDKKVGGFAR